jgi:predicted amidophosphoribosyltransferase
MVQRFKSGGDLALGPWLAGELAAHLSGRARPDLLVAPGLDPRRLRDRGFNQALELARTVGPELGVRVAMDGLARTRAATPQPGLGRRARAANLRGAFRCALDLRGLSVALVDDVMTTGATAGAGAAALRSAGAARVIVFALARTPEPRRQGV